MGILLDKYNKDKAEEKFKEMLRLVNSMDTHTTAMSNDATNLKTLWQDIQNDVDFSADDEAYVYEKIYNLLVNVNDFVQSTEVQNVLNNPPV